MNIHVNDSRQLRIHTYVLWLGIMFMVAYPLFSKQPVISMKIHMQMKPSTTYKKQQVRADVCFNVTIFTIETFYLDDYSSYFSRYMMYFKICHVKI